ncbi:ElyC/SanA/YdcF family protein [Hoeflea sp. CAU 1731]
MKKPKSAIILLWCPLAAAMAVLLFAICDFSWRMRSTETQKIGLGVVFTGQFVRVREGLALLDSDQIDRLFVSGVNRKAGMTIISFADQFGLNDQLRMDLSDGRLVLSAGARDTFENASETRCWLRKYPKETSVLLITSSGHMPRASLMLEFALKGRRVERLSILEASAGRGDFMGEFGKYVITYMLGCWRRIRWADFDECNQSLTS